MTRAHSRLAGYARPGPLPGCCCIREVVCGLDQYHLANVEYRPNFAMRQCPYCEKEAWGFLCPLAVSHARKQSSMEVVVLVIIRETSHSSSPGYGLIATAFIATRREVTRSTPASRLGPWQAAAGSREIYCSLALKMAKNCTFGLGALAR